MRHFTWQLFTAFAKMHSFDHQTLVMEQRASGQWHSMMAKRLQCCMTLPHDHLAFVQYQSLQNYFFCPCNFWSSSASWWSTSTPSDGLDRYFDLDHLSNTVRWIVQHSQLTGVKVSNGADDFTLVEQNQLRFDDQQEYLNRNKANVIPALWQTLLKCCSQSGKERSLWTVLLFSAAMDRNNCTTSQPPQGLSHGTGPHSRLTAKQTSCFSYSCLNLNSLFTIYAFRISISSGSSI